MKRLSLFVAIALVGCGLPPLEPGDHGSATRPRDGGTRGPSDPSPDPADPFATLCKPCNDASECGGPDDLCLVDPSNQRVCTADCSSRACPDGYRCASVGESSRQCVPRTGGCAAAPLDPDPTEPTEPAEPTLPATGDCGMTDVEARVFALTNEQRAMKSLPAYTCNATLVEVARAHSRAMCEQGFFSHVDPQGKAPWDRVAAAGLSPQSTGENIAGGQSTPEAAISSWMGSTGHRAAILSSSFDHIGVGHWSCSGGWGDYWTQVFTRGL